MGPGTRTGAEARGCGRGGGGKRREQRGEAGAQREERPRGAAEGAAAGSSACPPLPCLVLPSSSFPYRRFTESEVSGESGRSFLPVRPEVVH